MRPASIEHRASRSRLSIERRITVAAFSTALAVLVCAAAAFFAQSWRGEVAQHGREKRAVAHAVIRASGQGDTWRTAADLVRQIGDVAGVAAVKVLDPEGRMVAAVDARPALEHRSREVLLLPDGGRVLLIGGGWTVSQLLPETLSVSGALFFIATGLALFLGRALARRVVEPLDALSGFMRELTGRAGFDRRAPPSEVFEVGRLTDSFNDLLARLQANDTALNATMGELVKARDAAQAANVAKSRFLANMSHEIRTPLNGVLAMTEVIELGRLDAVQRDRMRIVRESGEALLAVLNDVLDVSKIEAGRMELAEAPFDFAALVRSTCESVGGAVGEKGLTFRLDIAPDAAGWRRGDEGRLRQVIGNLLSNAVKFTADGSVRVSARGWGQGGAEGVVLDVIDTGLGLAPEEIGHVFEKFTQADASITRRFGGSGLGLAICRELVQLMGGTIEVESTPAVGSRFRILLPLAAVAAPVAAPPPARRAETVARRPAGADRPVRVLAAEDNPTNQMVLSTIMDVFGVELEIVADGRQAVEAWRRGDFDLVLMDIQMPEMDGMAATRAIREAESAEGRPRTPIVALSANALTHQVSDYLAAGMDDHVAKPIELGRLQAVLAAVARPAEVETVAA